MSINTQSIKNNITNENSDEMILVVKREKLLENNFFSGLKKLNSTEIKKYLRIITDNKEFLPRSKMELDPNYKQIIPYLIFKFEDKYFLMQRQSTSSEQRLKNKFSFGIGGHIREEDMSSSNIIDWSKREFEEEVDYNGTYNVELIGLINDDSNDVGKVHIGFVFLIEGNSDSIKVKSELKSGQLLELSECLKYYDLMENWSKLIFQYLSEEK